MKSVLKGLLLGGALFLGTGGLFGMGSNFDDWYKAKLGRVSPMEEARVKAEAANTAFRAEPGPAPIPHASMEPYWQAKFGRSTPMEEARIKAERANTAFREEAGPRPTGIDESTRRNEYWKAKLGRVF